MTEWGIDTLFNPSKRYMDDEKRRLQSTREEVGDSSGGRRIDLDSGKLVIKRPQASTPRTEAEGAEPETAAAGDAEAVADPADPAATEDSHELSE